MSTDLVIERDLQRLPRTWDLEEICSRIAGGEALSQIALSYGKSKQALWKYLNKEDERRKQYLQALESRGIAHLEEIERIAVDVESGALDARSGAVAFQARAWVAARLNPRMLSEKWKAELDVQPSIQSLHLEAIRSLTKKQIDQNQVKTAVEVDGTYKGEKIPEEVSKSI